MIPSNINESVKVDGNLQLSLCMVPSIDLEKKKCIIDTVVYFFSRFSQSYFQSFAMAVVRNLYQTFLLTPMPALSAQIIKWKVIPNSCPSGQQ